MIENKNISDAILNTSGPLSAEQREAVAADERYIRVIAGAGAGKTETLTRKIIHRLLCRNEEPRCVAAFTFTEKAAQSMKSRIYERVRQLGGEEACARLGEMYVGTIHAFCLRVLQDHFGYTDFNVLDENQEMAFILREGWRLGLGAQGSYAENCKDFLRSVSVVYDEIIDRAALAVKAPEFSQQLEQYESALGRHRLLTFGRLIVEAGRCLERAPEKLKHIRHLIVDEYQDINRAQEKLIKIIGENASVFIVGDPRQSIYQWRGSDERCFDDFVKIFEGAKTVFMRENRRSLGNIVKAANRISGAMMHTSYEDLTALREDEGLVALNESDTPEEEADWVASQILHNVNQGKLEFGDCAILLRSVTTSAGPFIEALRARQIPFIIGGKVGLFRRKEAWALGCLFCWLWEEGFFFNDQWNRQDKITGDGLLAAGVAAWYEATGTAADVDRLRRWKSDASEGKFGNFTEIFHEALNILGFTQMDPEDPLHAAVMANAGRFSSLLADYESSIRLGGEKPDRQAAFKGLCWYINTYACGAYEEKMPDDIRGINAVQIMTVHQAKGLEWPLVFIPALVSTRFPSSMTGREQRWYLPRDMFDVRRYEGSVEDEKRLFYVAFTRAKDTLCLSRFLMINHRVGGSLLIRLVEGHLTVLKDGDSLDVAQSSCASGEEELQTFSVAEILTYLKCPYFYRLRELWTYKPGLAEPLGFGKSLHCCLRLVSDLVKKGAGIEEAVELAVKEKFHVPYAGGPLKEVLRAKARELLARFVTQRQEEMGKTEDVELRVEFPLHKAVIAGRADVILKDETRREVRDYKTSDEFTPFEQAALQVQLYVWGLAKLGKPADRASLAYLEEGEVREVDVGNGSLEKALAVAQSCIQGIKERKYAAAPGNFCGNCDQGPICRWRK